MRAVLTRTPSFAFWDFSSTTGQDRRRFTYAKIKGQLMFLALPSGSIFFGSNCDDPENGVHARAVYLVFARGRAFAEHFHHKATKNHNGDGAEKVARSVGGTAFACYVSKEIDIIRIVAETEANVGPIALFCSNAGVGTDTGRPQTTPRSAAACPWCTPVS